jgi:SAM-dependent MidA family methyltransferase
MNILEKIIISEIHKNGPITFEKFMNFALYYPQQGYYSSGKPKIGKEGDFYTSPHVHSAFGEVISNFILKAKDYLSANDFTIIEIGAGKGYLAFDILNHISKNNDEFNNINYVIIEKNEINFIQGLKKFKNKIKIFNNIEELGNNNTGVIISNELFDSLPFHRLIYQNNGIKEYYIDFVNNNFIEISEELSSSEINTYLERYNLNFTNFKQLEVNLLASEYLKNLSDILKKGFVITIDYGFLSDELFSNEKAEGTYRCFHKHTVTNNPYQYIGNQDITADVDFSNLILAGNKYELEKLKYTTQGQFLVDWGIIDIYEKALSHNNKGAKAIKNLFLPGMMGNYFKVLIQHKNIKEVADFYPDSELRISFGIN